MVQPFDSFSDHTFEVHESSNPNTDLYSVVDLMISHALQLPKTQIASLTAFMFVVGVSANMDV
jgi:hypothetical protein